VRLAEIRGDLRDDEDLEEAGDEIGEETNE
jgi:hypothetical protein